MADTPEEKPHPEPDKTPATKGDMNQRFKALHGMLLGHWEVITFLLEYLADRGALSVPDLQRHLEETLESDRAANLHGAQLAAIHELRCFLRGLPGASDPSTH